jgi:hypothetical protein
MINRFLEKSKTLPALLSNLNLPSNLYDMTDEFIKEENT